MTNQKRTHDAHVRICDEADAVACLLAEAAGVDKNKLLADLLHDALLGRGHALKIAAIKYSRLGIVGTDRV